MILPPAAKFAKRTTRVFFRPGCGARVVSSRACHRGEVQRDTMIGGSSHSIAQMLIMIIRS